MKIVSWKDKIFIYYKMTIQNISKYVSDIGKVFEIIKN